MSNVTIHKAKTDLSKLIARVEKGEEIVISRGNQPVAKLVPIAGKRPVSEALGMWKDVIVPEAFFEPLSEEELCLWEGPVEPSS